PAERPLASSADCSTHRVGGYARRRADHPCQQANAGGLGLPCRLAAVTLHGAYLWNAPGPAVRPGRDRSSQITGDTLMNASVHIPDVILHRGLFTTLDRSNPTASAVAIKRRQVFGGGNRSRN